MILHMIIHFMAFLLLISMILIRRAKAKGHISLAGFLCVTCASLRELTRGILTAFEATGKDSLWRNLAYIMVGISYTGINEFFLYRLMEILENSSIKLNAKTRMLPKILRILLLIYLALYSIALIFLTVRQYVFGIVSNWRIKPLFLLIITSQTLNLAAIFFVCIYFVFGMISIISSFKKNNMKVIHVIALLGVSQLTRMFQIVFSTYFANDWYCPIFYYTTSWIWELPPVVGIVYIILGK